MKLLKPSPSVSKNAFDLSHRHLMTANFGELLPITCLETVPGDYIQMRVSDLLRALPMVTSPFMRVKQHIDVWFCPYDYLWHNFEAFLTMKDNPVSSGTKGFDYVPHTTKDQIGRVFNNSTVATYKDVIGRDYITGAKKIMDFLGYGRNFYKGGSTDTSKSVNLWRLLTYNKIWYDEYRQKYYDTGHRLMDDSDSVAKLFNVDYLDCTSVSNARLSWGNLIPKMQMRYRLWKKDLYTGVLPATQFGSVSAVPFNGSVPVTISGSATLSGYTDVNLRDVMYKSDGTPTAPSGLPDNGFTYTTQLDRNSIASGSSYRFVSQVPEVPDQDLQMYVQGYPSVMQDSDGDNIIAGHTHSISGTASISSSGSAGLHGTSFDILALRHAQAVQIWRENALRAGNRISDNMRAHYGDDAEYDDHRCQFLGSVDAPLNIGDIDAHAQTGSQHGQQLADVAGKGLSSVNQHVFKFKAKKFGTIMVMFSLLPEAEYESQGIDGMNTLLEREDYFQREFQNTGLKSIHLDNFYYDPNRQATGPLGYAPAYVDYKQKLDKCFDGFWSDQPFSPWASPKSDIPEFIAASLSGGFVVPLSTLYVNPMLYDRNFGVAVSGEPDAEATSEQVICDFYFDVSATRPMSVVGLPQNI